MTAMRLSPAHALCDEDLAPQLVSWAISIAMAAAWLVLVNLAPLPVIHDAPPAVHGPVVDFNLRAYTAPHTAERAKPTLRSVTGGDKAHRPASALDVAGIFAVAIAEHAVAKVVDLIPAVHSARGDASAPRADKSALATTGTDDTPGMSKFGSAQAGGGEKFGQVERRTTIDRARFNVRPLPVVSAPALGDQVADATQLGAFVRARVSQLQTCYERAGGTDLAGVVALRLTLGSGGWVRAAEIVRRTWSGPGAAETEACLLAIARGWRVPAGAEGATMTIPISFTRGT